MTRRLRIIAFITAVGCFALAAGISHLGFELWPPRATMADGRTTPFLSADTEACLRGRALAWFGDRSGDAYWRSCREQLLQYRALDGLEVRLWTVAGFCLVGLGALL